MSMDDGMPAFPTLEEHGFNNGCPGLTRRQYFAAHVDISDFKPMAVLEQKHGYGKVTVAQLADHIAELRFMLADAMIAEGSKP